MKKLSILFAVLLTCAIIAACQSENQSSPANANTEPLVLKQFIDTSGDNDIFISFPEIVGMQDKEKEEIINGLIENDVKKILTTYTELMVEKKLNLWLDYEVKKADERIISIFYHGNGRAATYAGNAEAMATTIDVINAQILTLNDIVTDFDELFELLINGKFVATTLWENTKSSYLVDIYYDGENRDQLRDILELESTNWYTDGANFVIVLDGKYYEEYAIALGEIERILSPHFLECINIAEIG